MPNGVICGGAVDGSNHAGEIVTCQAMTTRPVGAGPAAIDIVPKTRIARTSQPINARRERQLRSNIIRRFSPPTNPADSAATSRASGARLFATLAVFGAAVADQLGQITRF